MKNIVLVFNVKNNHLVGAYPDITTAEVEIYNLVCNNKFNFNDLLIKEEKDIPDNLFTSLTNQYKRTIKWN